MSGRARPGGGALLGREVAGWVRGRAGRGRGRGVVQGWGVRGDLVGLAVTPRVGLGMATTTGKMSVARGIEDPSVVVRLVDNVLLSPVGAVVERHRGDARPRSMGQNP